YHIEDAAADGKGEAALREAGYGKQTTTPLQCARLGGHPRRRRLPGAEPGRTRLRGRRHAPGPGRHPAGSEPAGSEPAGSEPAGAEPAGAEPARSEAAGAEPAAAEPAAAWPAAAAAPAERRSHGCE